MEKINNKNIVIFIVCILVALVIIDFFIIVEAKIIKDKENQINQYKNDIINLKNTELKLFDCRLVNRNNIIIGFDNISLISKIDIVYPFKFNETYLIDNPLMCNETNSYCTPYFNTFLNETVDWMIENGACDIYKVKLSEII